MGRRVFFELFSWTLKNKQAHPFPSSGTEPFPLSRQHFSEWDAESGLALCLEILVLHMVAQSLLGFRAKQKKYILEVQHKARKLMKRAPEVMVFPSSMYLGVFQCLRMVFRKADVRWTVFCTSLLGGCVRVGTASCWTCRFHPCAVGLFLPHLQMAWIDLWKLFPDC